MSGLGGKSNSGIIGTVQFALEFPITADAQQKTFYAAQTQGAALKIAWDTSTSK
jgi:hypothetical protein